MYVEIYLRLLHPYVNALLDIFIKTKGLISSVCGCFCVVSFHNLYVMCHDTRGHKLFENVYT